MELDYLVIAAHPDDAELGMGGTIMALKAQGATVGLLDLTSGEPTPHGSPEIRARETEAANRILAIDWRGNLGLANRSLVADLEARHRLAGMLRQLRPRVLLTHYWEDSHPDHVAASSLVDAARFWAKLSKSDLPHEPHFPQRILYFFSVHLRLHIQPSFVLDVTEQHDAKMAAIACYHSQFIAGRPIAPPTILDEIRDRGRYWGWTIGTGFGEPFVSREEVGLRSFAGLAVTPRQPLMLKELTKEDWLNLLGIPKSDVPAVLDSARHPEFSREDGGYAPLSWQGNRSWVAGWNYRRCSAGRNTGLPGCLCVCLRGNDGVGNRPHLRRLGNPCGHPNRQLRCARGRLWPWGTFLLPNAPTAARARRSTISREDPGPWPAQSFSSQKLLRIALPELTAPAPSIPPPPFLPKGPRTSNAGLPRDLRPLTWKPQLPTPSRNRSAWSMCRSFMVSITHAVGNTCSLMTGRKTCAVLPEIPGSASWRSAWRRRSGARY